MVMVAGAPEFVDVEVVTEILIKTNMAKFRFVLQFK